MAGAGLAVVTEVAGRAAARVVATTGVVTVGAVMG